MHLWGHCCGSWSFQKQVRLHIVQMILVCIFPNHMWRLACILPINVWIKNDSHFNVVSLINLPNVGNVKNKEFLFLYFITLAGVCQICSYSTTNHMPMFMKTLLCMGHGRSKRNLSPYIANAQNNLWWSH